MIHWDKTFQPGMAYVCLGRTQRLEDIYIVESKDKFDPSSIHAHPDALIESERIHTEFEKLKGAERQLFENHFNISYLNINRLKSHLQDVIGDPYLMKFEIIALAETWLNPSDTVEIPGYSGPQINQGNGKGLATFVKADNFAQFQRFVNEKFSAIRVDTDYCRIVFLYVSKYAEWNELQTVLDDVIEDETLPTAVIGDMNFDVIEDNHQLKLYLSQKNFHQLVKNPTHERGRLIDHVYINALLNSKTPLCCQKSVYYSDHDIVTLHIPK